MAVHKSVIKTSPYAYPLVVDQLDGQLVKPTIDY